eukprot:scaffold434_cov186-Pinguiococcus_pyrenoidosus.AAC.14
MTRSALKGDACFLERRAVVARAVIPSMNCMDCIEAYLEVLRPRSGVVEGAEWRRENAHLRAVYWTDRRAAERVETRLDQ